MTLLDKLRYFPRTVFKDEKGDFLKIMTGFEPIQNQHIKEIYLIRTLPGRVRGNHYHPKTCEWFTLIEGRASLHLCDPSDQRELTINLDSKAPVTIEIPPGLAHALVSEGTEEMWMLAATDRQYDALDVVPYIIIGNEKR